MDQRWRFEALQELLGLDKAGDLCAGEVGRQTQRGGIKGAEEHDEGVRIGSGEGMRGGDQCV